MSSSDIKEIPGNDPGWFVAGHPIRDVYSRSIDAHYILDDEVDVGGETVSWGDLEWRECQIPISYFEISPASYEGYLQRLYLLDPEYERDRKQYIEEWISQEKSAIDAIAKSPLLATIKNGKLKLEDGHHRLAIAHFIYKLETVTVICGSLDKLPPRKTLQPR